MKTHLPGTKKNSKTIFAAKVKLDSWFFRFKKILNFLEENIVGTAAEKEALHERNKLVERRERKWIDEPTKVYYELKQYLHESAINRLQRFW